MSNSIPTRLLTPCILLLLMLAACRNSSPWGRQGEVADSLIEQHPDSVLHLLQGIDYNALDEEGQAHYGLLLTAARYKLYQPVDTTFINRSIAYYSASHKGIQSSPSWGDKRGWGSNSSPLGGDKRGASLYYKAVVLYDLGKKQEATLLLKQAEQQAEHSDDELLRNKIYDFLSYINYQSGNNDLDAAYGQLFLKSSQRLHDTLQMARAYDYLAATFSRTGEKDSMRNMQDSCLALINKTDKESKAYILSNLADTHISDGDYQRAEQLLHEAISIKPMANQYVMLGKLRKACSDTTQARLCWERATTFNDKRFSTEAYSLLAQLYSERGDYRLAHLYDSLSTVNGRKSSEEMQTAEISNLQHRFDHLSVRKRSSQAVRCLTLTTLIMAGLFLLCLAYAILKRRTFSEMVKKGRLTFAAYRRENEAVKNDNRRLLSESRQLHQRNDLLKSRLEERNKALEEAKRESTAQLSTLRKKLSTQMERNDSLTEELRKQHLLTDAISMLPNIIGHGEEVWKTLETQRQYPKFSADDMKAVLSYYAYTFSEKYNVMMNSYRKLEPKYQLFLILQEFNFSYNEFASLLNITPSAVRNYPYRIRQREKIEK